MKLSIKKPCQENFEEFAATQSGGFCQSCQKEVIDFTKMTDFQILNYFSQNQGKSCGRFSQTQLKTYPELSMPKRNWNTRLMSASILSISLLTSVPFTKGHAQSNQASSAIYLNQEEDKETKPQELKKKEGLVAEGIVLSDENIPLEGVVVMVKNTDRGVLTDEEGKFKLDKLISGDELLFSYVGYKRKTYIVPETSAQALTINLDINMSIETCVLMGEVAIDKAYTSKRSFWQRVKGVFR